jgi:excisionase family DNA binding protein
VTTTEIDPDQLLTSTEVGNLLQVNPSSVKKWVNDGRIVAFRTPGGHRRIKAADLVQFLDSHRIPLPRALQSAGRRRVLIVDDDVRQLKALQRLFKRYSDKVDVVACDDGIDALVRVGSYKPHLIMLDAYMPGLDGVEVCRRLQANPDTKDIMLAVTSGRMTPDLEASAMAAGARLVLRKPVEVSAVLAELGLQAQLAR